ncbi:histidine kinase [Actinoplanes sp. NPDC051851]|uniref:sensor histidine kinase n=1 Tax=Actinoplanes sp. NPDC051851 TaxID=3154753 RepID=UPI00343D649C
MRSVLLNWSVAIAVGVLSVVGALHGMGHGRIPLAVDLVSAVGVTIAIGLSTFAPLPVLAVVVLTAVVYEAIGWSTPALIAAMVAALYRLALHSRRRVSWAAALASGGAWWAASAFEQSSQLWTLAALSSFAWTGLAVAYGDAVRNRRAYLAEVEERVRRVEVGREQEVRQRVAEERLRIARELHDVVAHHMAVITVQSGAAAYALSRQPSAAEPALHHIRQASQVVLKELAAIVGLLREPGAGKSPAHPQPGLDTLPQLLAGFAATGAKIDFEYSGEVRDLSASGSLAAYRIIQEALTNARKHGDGDTIHVRLRYERDCLQLEIINGVPETASTRDGGFGLIGMRERAAAADGSAQIGRTQDGRFSVHVTLPAPR